MKAFVPHPRDCFVSSKLLNFTWYALLVCNPSAQTLGLSNFYRQSCVRDASTMVSGFWDFVVVWSLQVVIECRHHLHHHHSTFPTSSGLATWILDLRAIRFEFQNLWKKMSKVFIIGFHKPDTNPSFHKLWTEHCGLGMHCFEQATHKIWRGLK